MSRLGWLLRVVVVVTALVVLAGLLAPSGVVPAVAAVESGEDSKAGDVVVETPTRDVGAVAGPGDETVGMEWEPRRVLPGARRELVRFTGLVDSYRVGPVAVRARGAGRDPLDVQILPPGKAGVGESPLSRSPLVFRLLEGTPEPVVDPDAAPVPRGVVPGLGEGTRAPLGVSVDYSAFRDLYGAGYGARLRLLRYPECVLSTPLVPACSTPEIVPAVNDSVAGTITPITPVAPDTVKPSEGTPVDEVPVDEAPAEELPVDEVPVDEAPTEELPAEEAPFDEVPAEEAPAGDVLAEVVPSGSVSAAVVGAAVSGGSVYALSAGAQGAGGNFSATPMGVSSSWSVGEQSGGFEYGYPVEVPPVTGEAAPSLALGYSSGSVDGRTSGDNTQSSWVGMGWDLQVGFIERRYTSCADDGQSGKGDLCWATDNAFINLNGKSTELARVGTSNVWRLVDDPGWKVVKVSGAVPNGDNDKEFWKVQTPEGTTYWFGRGFDPELQGENTAVNDAPLGSAFTVPVFGDDAGEPCHQSSVSASWCQQAWRWNLDYVEDRFGNASSYHYTKETNNYGKWGSPTDEVSYVRGGYLTRVDYGKRSGSTEVAAQVAFTSVKRCRDEAGDGSGPCPPETEANAAEYPDVPVDLLCTTNCTDRLSPAFFSSYRLEHVVTRALVGGVMTGVTDHELTATFPDPDGTGPDVPSLWLSSVSRTGRVGTDLVLPSVVFSGVSLANRVDTTASVTPLKMFRVASVRNELGGVVEVSYGHEGDNGCTESSLPSPSNNTKECFPRYWVPDCAGCGGFGWFHKWTVQRIKVTDPPRGVTVSDTANDPSASEPQVFDYDYLGQPWWHHDDVDTAVVPAGTQSWGQWRGFQQVRVSTKSVSQGRVATGTGSDESVRTSLYYTGMNGDKQPSGTPRSVSIVTAQFGTVTDADQFAGRVLQTTTVKGSSAYSRSSSAYGSMLTVDHPRIPARMVLVTSTKSWVPQSNDSDGRISQVLYDHYDPGTPTSRANQVQTGAVTATDTAGEDTTAVDNTCTLSAWASNDSNWRLFPAQSALYGGTCDALGSIASRTRWLYDGSETMGEVTGSGRLTRVVRWWGGGDNDKVAESFAYDALGRPTLHTDARGSATQTEYFGYVPAQVNRTVVTNTAGHASTTYFQPATGAVTKVTDAAGLDTTAEHDALGRVTEVRRPGQSASEPPSALYIYQATATGVPYVRTRTLQNTVWVESVDYLDGWGRVLENHVASADGSGRTIVANRYDEQGLVWATTAPLSNDLGLLNDAGTGPRGRINPDPGDVGSETRTLYDGAGRPVSQTLVSVGAGQHTTNMSYNGLRTTVNPPVGGDTVSIADVFGRLVRTEDFTGAATMNTADATAVTSRTYTRRGEIATITDPQSNVTTMGYDLMGRRTSLSDPDQGDTSTGYDAGGNPVTTTDALGQVLTSTFDGLNRRTDLYAGAAAAGNRIGKWVFDTVRPGTLTSAASYTAGALVATVAVGGYTANGEVASRTWTVPAAPEPSMPTTYTESYAYDTAGNRTRITVGAAAGVAAEEITTSYDTYGRPEATSGLTSYVTSTSFNGYGYLSARVHNAGSGTPVSRQYTYNTATRRLSRVTAYLATTATGTKVTDDNYDYNDVGNIVGIRDAVASQARCSTYDGLGRLAHAWTSSLATNCTNSGEQATQVGPYGYNAVFTYTASGNISSRKDLGTVRTFTYPGSGSTSVRPHAVTSVSGLATSYTYNVRGQQTGRTISGDSASLLWDGQGQLVRVDPDAGAGTSDSTRFTYDADGTRISRRTPTDLTYTLGSTEIRIRTGDTTPTVTRDYHHAGTLVAQRSTGPAATADGTAGLTWILNDHQASSTLAVKQSTGTVTRGYLTPYGAPRTTNLMPTDRVFLGKTTDPTTSLTHLDARYYDATIGRFLSPDPLIDARTTQTPNAYTYAANNPITHSDPTGLTLGLRYPCGGGACEAPRLNIPDGGIGSIDTTPERPRRHGSRPVDSGYLTLCALDDVPCNIRVSKGYGPEVPPSTVPSFVTATFEFFISDYAGCAQGSAFDCTLAGIGLIPGVGKLASTGVKGVTKLGSRVLGKGAESEGIVPVVSFSRSRAPGIASNFDNAVANGAPTRLNRATGAARDANRRAALRGQQPAPAGKSLDEYPFACSAQGGAGSCVSAVPVAEQSYQGGVLSRFFQDNNIRSGDPFDVEFVR